MHDHADDHEVRFKMKKAALLLTNYLRPGSLQKQLRTLKSVRDTFDIYVIDNSDRRSNLRHKIALENWYYYIENGTNLGAGYRFLMSSGLPHEFLIAIDDDIFLTIDQLSFLYQALRADPNRLHGVWGQTLDFKSEGHLLRGGLQGKTVAVQVISRVYAYTPQIAFRSICVAKEAGFTTWRDIGPTDDILLSAASFEAPICHAVADLSVCNTSDADGIATWKTKGFFPARDRLIDKLLELGFFQGARQARD
jgi:hypothetical protein